MLGAGLEQVHLVVLDDDLGLDDLEALRAEAVGEVVVDVGAVVPHPQRILLGGDRCGWNVRLRSRPVHASHTLSHVLLLLFMLHKDPLFYAQSELLCYCSASPTLEVRGARRR